MANVCPPFYRRTFDQETSPSIGPLLRLQTSASSVEHTPFQWASPRAAGLESNTAKPKDVCACVCAEMVALGLGSLGLV